MSAFEQGALDFGVVTYELVPGITGPRFKCLYSHYGVIFNCAKKS